MKLTLIRAAVKLVYKTVSLLVQLAGALTHIVVLLLFALAAHYTCRIMHLPYTEKLTFNIILGTELAAYFLCRLVMFFIFICKGG